MALYFFAEYKKEKTSIEIFSPIIAVLLKCTSKATFFDESTDLYYIYNLMHKNKATIKGE